MNPQFGTRAAQMGMEGHVLSALPTDQLHPCGTGDPSTDATGIGRCGHPLQPGTPIQPKTTKRRIDSQRWARRRQAEPPPHQHGLQQFLIAESRLIQVSLQLPLPEVIGAEGRMQ